MENHPVNRAMAVPASGTPERRTEDLAADEALELFGTVGLGRIVYTRSALPAVRPVNHLLDGGDIVVRVQDDSTLAALLSTQDGSEVVVACEADAIDPHTHLGWSAVATGYAGAVTDPTELNRYARLLEPWAEGPVSGAVRIRPGVVTGFRIRADDSKGSA
ncbi:pyridoxamine 5'-phosphate oxidase family protein [Streptomyces virginiae]|uniref:pyridoxamine 5'-phosphate oxidase family protein n=1 Tax=Streptomyces virginiae TaxID=1961 RepID=UPI0036D08498